MNSKEKGIINEEIATDYLQNQGYTILERNWRSSHYEIDIIAQKDKMIIFIEVKSRGSDKLKTPEENVNQTKQKNIIKAANNYILIHNIKLEARFDIVSIINANGNKTINIIPDAFSCI